MKIENLLGAKVFAIFENENVGTVTKIALSKDWKCLLGVFFSHQSQNFHALRKNFFSFGNGVVFVRNKSKIASGMIVEHESFQSGTEVVCIDGSHFGMLTNLTVDNDGMIENFSTSLSKNFTPKQILSWSSELIMVWEEKERKIASFKPHTPFSATVQQRVEILQPLSQISPSKVLAQKEVNPLGLTVSGNFVGENNEIILLAGEKISQNHIELAKKQGILRNLVFLAE